jgi:hypothetical protein
MPGVLVICEEHGLVDGSQFIAFENSDVSVAGSEAWCPICGRPAEIADGKYSDRSGVFSAQLRLSPSQIETLRKSLRWAEQELAKPEPDEDRAVRVLEATIERAVPDGRSFLEHFRGKTSMAAAAWLACLIALVTLLVSVTANQGINPEDLERILDETVRSAQNEQPREAPAEPTESPPPQPSPESIPPATELPTPKTR